MQSSQVYILPTEKSFMLRGTSLAIALISSRIGTIQFSSVNMLHKPTWSLISHYISSLLFLHCGSNLRAQKWLWRWLLELLLNPTFLLLHLLKIFFFLSKTQNFNWNPLKFFSFPLQLLFLFWLFSLLHLKPKLLPFPKSN